MGYFSLHYIFIICVSETINLSKLICDFHTVKENLSKLHIHIRRTQIAKMAGVQPIESCFPWLVLLFLETIQFLVVCKYNRMNLMLSSTMSILYVLYLVIWTLSYFKSARRITVSAGGMISNIWRTIEPLDYWVVGLLGCSQA